MSRRRRRQVVEELAAFVLFQLWHKKLASYESGAGGTALGWLTMVVRSQVAQFWREHKPPRDLLLVSLPEWDLCEDRVDYALYEDIDTLGSQPPSESDTEPIAEVEELSLGDLTENLLGQVHLLATPKQRDALDRYYQDDWWSDADRQAKARLSRRVRQDASLRQEHRRVLTAVERSALPALRLYVQRKRWVNARVPARRGETMAAKGLPLLSATCFEQLEVMTRH